MRYMSNTEEQNARVHFTFRVTVVRTCLNVWIWGWAVICQDIARSRTRMKVDEHPSATRHPPCPKQINFPFELTGFGISVPRNLVINDGAAAEKRR